MHAFLDDIRDSAFCQIQRQVNMGGERKVKLYSPTITKSVFLNRTFCPSMCPSIVLLEAKNSTDYREGKSEHEVIQRFTKTPQVGSASPPPAFYVHSRIPYATKTFNFTYIFFTLTLSSIGLLSSGSGCLCPRLSESWSRASSSSLLSRC